MIAIQIQDEFMNDPLTPMCCPACNHLRYVCGSVHPADPDAACASSFHPEGSAHWIKLQGADLVFGSSFQCCLNCGLVWNYTEQESVMSILEKQGVKRGTVPKRTSYSVHLLKWFCFLLVCLAIATFITAARHH